MPKEESLTIPNQENLTRINKDCERPFYYVFKEEVGGAGIITTEMRKNIVNRWALLTPLVPVGNLRHHLYNMEQKFWAATTPWSQQQLTNKITKNSIALVEEVYESNEAITKKARVIDQLNQTVAKVNRLIDQAPAATFFIQTNVNEADMTREMNKIEDAELVDEEE
jgi:hypothetical protein